MCLPLGDTANVVYKCTGEEHMVSDTDLKNACDHGCNFGQTFELEEETVVSSFELTIRLNTPEEADKRIEIWLISGSPPLGTSSTAEEWTKTNYITTIYRSDTRSFSGGNCREWHTFELENALQLEAGTYTVSWQLVDDDGFYSTDCEGHNYIYRTWSGSGYDFIWYVGYHDNSGTRRALHWQVDNGNAESENMRGGFFEARNYLLGLRVNSGTSCRPVGK